MSLILPLPYHTDASIYFSALRDLPWAAWLDSGGCGRYDVLVAQPVTTLSTQDGRTLIAGVVGEQWSKADPFSLLREYLGETSPPVAGIPFAGGVLGYWGYDLAHGNLHVGTIAQDDDPLPEMAVGIYDWAVVVDHQQKQSRLVSHQRHDGTAGILPQIMRRLQEARPGAGGADKFRVYGDIKSSLDRESYRRAFGVVQEFLREGDCYQVNLARRFAAMASGDAYAAYLELRRLSPAPYAAFLDWPQLQVLCASPELFLKVCQGRVETRPIKGTRARSRDSAEDEREARALSLHTKDRAENLMIVDLLRNDLSRNCETGSVHTPGLFEVESFSNVHHLVSTVAGRLRRDSHALDLLRDCFPGGSVTGAPKRRAMEIIEQLEPVRRGVYCGAIGYIGYDGEMEVNIAIRTMVCTRGEIRCWAGGGIVADSQCEAEYQETLDKASAMLEVMRCFGGKPGV